MPVSKAAIRHAVLIKNRRSDDEVHMWQEDKESPALLCLSPLPEDPVLISHPAWDALGPDGDHGAALNAFPNLTVNVSGR